MTGQQSPAETIFHEFGRACEPGWVSGEILYRQVGRTSEAEFEATNERGDVSYPMPTGSEIFQAIEALRATMAQPGTGAWFSAAIKLTSAGGFSMNANYDDEPVWDVPVVAETYVEEQELFPRDEANQPDWYRDRLHEASKA